MPPEAIDRLKNKKLRAFYERQNDMIRFMRQVDADLAEADEAACSSDAPAPGKGESAAPPLLAVPEGKHEAASTAAGGATGRQAWTAEDATGLAVPAAAPAAAADAGLPQVQTAAEKAAAKAQLARAVAFAINASFAANFALLGIKLYAAITSGSMAVVASLVDSCLDLFSGSIIWLSSWLASRRSLAHPVGKSRYEPLAIIVFAAVMGVASIQLLSEGAQQIAAGTRSDASTGTLVCLGVVVAIKAALWVLCYGLRGASDSVAALAEDHRNDVLTNSATLLAVGLAMRFPAVWWLDQALCCGLAVFILVNWAGTAREQISLLASQAATPAQCAQLTYVALTHCPSEVRAVDTVLAYTVGSRLQAEVDIVLPRDMPLWRAHDIGEALQRRLERLDNVERAFVHQDTEFHHSRAIEHANPYDSD